MQPDAQAHVSLAYNPHSSPFFSTISNLLNFSLERANFFPFAFLRVTGQLQSFTHFCRFPLSPLQLSIAGTLLFVRLAGWFSSEWTKLLIHTTRLDLAKSKNQSSINALFRVWNLGNRNPRIVKINQIPISDNHHFCSGKPPKWFHFTYAR